MSTKAASSFQRQMYLFVAGLTGLCLLLIFLTSLQGTRVRSAAIDTVKATQQGGQRLLLQLNQPAGTIDTKDISISPDVQFSAISGGTTIALQFAQPLRNSTTYTLTIKAHGKNIRHSFTTEPASFFYVTDVVGGSELHKRWLGTNKDSVVLTSEPIDDYIVLGDTVVYTTIDQTRKASLRIFNSATGEHKEVPLPEDGTIYQLRAAPNGGSFGFIFTASNFSGDNTYILNLYDMSRGTLQQVQGFGDKPLKAVDWQFARNGKTIAAVSTDQTVLLVNPGSPPTPLGQYDGLEDFTFDDSSLLLTGRAGKQIVNLKNGQRTSLPAVDDDSHLYSATPLNTEDGLLMLGLSYLATNQKTKIMVSRNDISKEIYSLAADEGTIAFTTLSPNDQYVAMEIRNGLDTTSVIEIIDTWRGDAVAKFNGSKIRWP